MRSLLARRAGAFQIFSEGNITSWRWDFGDGTTSNEQRPIPSKIVDER